MTSARIGARTVDVVVHELSGASEAMTELVRNARPGRGHGLKDWIFPASHEGSSQSTALTLIRAATDARNAYKDLRAAGVDAPNLRSLFKDLERTQEAIPYTAQPFIGRPGRFDLTPEQFDTIEGLQTRLADALTWAKGLPE